MVTQSRRGTLRKLRSVSLLVVAGGLAALALAVSAAGGPAATAQTPQKITVTMTEFKFVLKPKTAKKGTVVFTVVNRGTVVHDFKIAGKKTSRIRAGKRGTLRVTFKKTGRFPYLCTLPSHAPAGMKGVLVIR
jgi:uncharacterized cupredoxin-like copper-binding protein